jgi:hypothetical protein
MIATLVKFGANSYVIWEFAARVVAIMFVMVLILMAISVIRDFIR